jgi:hypothetical protein
MYVHPVAYTVFVPHPLLHSVLPAAAARVDFERARIASPPIPPLDQRDGMQTLQPAGREATFHRGWVGAAYVVRAL